MARKCLFQASVLTSLLAIVPARSATEAVPSAKSDDARIASLTAICAKVTCRMARRNLSLHGPNGTTVEASTELYPYVDDHGAIVIYPGEKIAVALAMQAEALGQPRLVSVLGPGGATTVKDANPPAANLSFELGEMPKPPGMLLTVINQIHAVVKYDVVTFVATNSGFRSARSSSCPLQPPQPGLESFGGFENWPYPIVMMVISNIRILPEGSAAICQ